MSSVKNVIKDNYNAMLINDFLREKIKDAGFSNVEISKTPTGTRVVLHVTRPGIVIGRKGTGIKDLTEILEKQFNLKNPQIAVEEIQKQVKLFLEKLKLPNKSAWKCEIHKTESRTGGGALPEIPLESAALVLSHPEWSANDLQEWFRSQPVPVIVRAVSYTHLTLPTKRIV